MAHAPARARRRRVLACAVPVLLLAATPAPVHASGGVCRVDMHCGDLPEGADQKKSSDLVHERQPAGSCAGNVCYCTVGSSGKAAYGCANCAVSVASDTGTSRKMI